MPVMDGFEASRRILAARNGRKATPIVAMTANAMPGDRERCPRSGHGRLSGQALSPSALAGYRARGVDLPGAAIDRQRGAGLRHRLLTTPRLPCRSFSSLPCSMPSRPGIPPARRCCASWLELFRGEGSTAARQPAGSLAQRRPGDGDPRGAYPEVQQCLAWRAAPVRTCRQYRTGLARGRARAIDTWIEEAPSLSQRPLSRSDEALGGQGATSMVESGARS